MTIKEARKILGNAATNLSDEQVQRYIFDCTALAHIIVDSFISLPPAERAKYRTKPSPASAPPVAQDILTEPANYQI